MDTVPFNILMFVVDVVLIVLLIYWRTQPVQVVKNTELGLMQSEILMLNGTSSKKPKRPPSVRSRLFILVWFFAALVDLAMIKGVSLLFRFHYGQNVIEGLCWHFGPFLMISGIILFVKMNRITACFSFICGLTLFLIGVDCMLYEPYALTVEHYKVVSDKVDKPIRIVFVADTQTDWIGSHERRVFQTMKDQNADLVILGGDYLQCYGSSVKNMPRLPDDFRRALESVEMKPPLGAFAIYGNNENGEAEFKKLFKDTGFRAISRTQTLDLGPIMFTILSLGDSALSKYHDGKREKVFLTTDEQRKKFHVMAGHVPAYATVKTDADLLLAGHTHGGQVHIPFYGPILTGMEATSGFQRRWGSGMTILPEPNKGVPLLVTRGSGMERGWAPEIRFFCKPEVSVIDIVPPNDSNR